MEMGGGTMEKNKNWNVIDMASRRDPVKVYERRFIGRKEVSPLDALVGVHNRLKMIERHLRLGGLRTEAIEAMREVIGYCRASF